MNADARTRPNVLLITTDQQAALAVGAAGNPDLSTPAMDALGERGVRFERAYCTFPLCTPSRASLYTGRMPHEVGADYNNKPIAPEFRARRAGQSDGGRRLRLRLRRQMARAGDRDRRRPRLF